MYSESLSLHPTPYPIVRAPSQSHKSLKCPSFYRIDTLSNLDLEAEICPESLCKKLFQEKNEQEKLHNLLTRVSNSV